MRRRPQGKSRQKSRQIAAFMLSQARRTTNTWHQFLNDFVDDPEIATRFKTQPPRWQSDSHPLATTTLIESGLGKRGIIGRLAAHLGHRSVTTRSR